MVTAHEVARKAKRIFPLMGRLMEANMRIMEVSERGGERLPPVHFHVLTALNNRPFTLSDLAEFLAISPASLSRTVTVLEDRAWLTRTRSNEDRRIVTINITEAGHDVLEEVERRSEDYLIGVFEKLDDEHLQTVLDGLEVLINAFSQSMTRVPSDADKP